jgi:GAF domain-containing protein
MHGYRVLFTTAAALLIKLIASKKAATLERHYRNLDRIDLLLIDELGYVPFEREAIDLLFQLISQRYERRSIALTTNLPFEKWTQVFPDEMTATAVSDRLVHHGAVFAFTGQSHRLRTRRKPPKNAWQPQGFNLRPPLEVQNLAAVSTFRQRCEVTSRSSQGYGWRRCSKRPRSAAWRAVEMVVARSLSVSVRGALFVAHRQLRLGGQAVGRLAGFLDGHDWPTVCPANRGATNDGDGAYTATRSFGNDVALNVSENDGAILALKTWRAPLDPHHYSTALQGALALPMVSRGRLLGVLLLGERVGGEAYAPDEVEALSQFAHGVGSAIDALSTGNTDSIAALRVSMASMADGMASLGNTMRELQGSIAAELRDRR